MSHNVFLMNKPWALWKYLKRHGKNHFQLSQTQHISSCQSGWEQLHWAALWRVAGAVQLKSSLEAAGAAVPRHSSHGWVPGQEKHRGDCARRRGGLLELCLLYLWHGPPNSPKNSPHLRKKENVWGQSKRKRFQGRASLAGRCGARVIGGAWEVHAASQERHCKWRGRISPFWEKAKWEKWVDLLPLQYQKMRWIFISIPSFSGRYKNKIALQCFYVLQHNRQKRALWNRLNHTISLFLMHFQWRIPCWTLFTVLT